MIVKITKTEELLPILNKWVMLKLEGWKSPREAKLTKLPKGDKITDDTILLFLVQMTTSDVTKYNIEHPDQKIEKGTTPQQSWITQMGIVKYIEVSGWDSVNKEETFTKIVNQ